METNSVFGKKSLSAQLNSTSIDIYAIVGVCDSDPSLANRIYKIESSDDESISLISLSEEESNGFQDSTESLIENLNNKRFNHFLFSDCDPEEASTTGYAILKKSGEMSFIKEQTENAIEALREAMISYRSEFGDVMDIGVIDLDDNLF